MTILFGAPVRKASANDLVMAREAAAMAQSDAKVKAAILSGKFDVWPNVQGCIYAIQATHALAPTPVPTEAVL